MQKPLTIFIRINTPSLLVAPPPLLSTFAKFIFWGFTSISTASTFAIPGLKKKTRFSTSPRNKERIGYMHDDVYIRAINSLYTRPF